MRSIAGQPARRGAFTAMTWGLAAALSLSAASAGGWPPPRKQELPLRLDESPELPLLEPFRHPSGAPATALARYRRGQYGRWVRRMWSTLGWSDDSSNPAWDVRPAGRDACLARATEPRLGWPLVQSAEHFFLLGEDHLGALAVSDQVVAPWLRRLDPHWAGTLLASAGCGRGGSCSAGVSFPAAAFEELWRELAPYAFPVPAWKCKERPVRLMRMGAEQQSFVLVGCDGAIAGDALETLSTMARTRKASRPTSWPEQPLAGLPTGEWLDGVRLVHPRLLWLLHRLADTFRWRAIYIYSGYRRPGGSAKAAGHGSQHHQGRALDIAVEGVSREELLATCFQERDVGCGYYPNNKFVHVDVRPPGHGRAVWVDAAAPGEPSRYVPEWPGVVERGRVVWRRVR